MAQTAARVLGAGHRARFHVNFNFEDLMNFRAPRVLAAIGLGAALAMSACAPAARNEATHAQSAAHAPITQEEVIAAQNAWGDGLVRIATTYDERGREAARAAAAEFIDTAYAYASTPVLFKPTLASPPTTFRTTREGALSYFVGGDPNFPSDSGFALRGWRSYEVQNAAIFIDGDMALTMGKVRLTDRNGNVTVVDKSWAFHRGEDGRLRIVLHHSSLPYQP